MEKDDSILGKKFPRAFIVDWMAFVFWFCSLSFVKILNCLAIAHMWKQRRRRRLSRLKSFRLFYRL